MPLTYGTVAPASRMRQWRGPILAALIAAGGLVLATKAAPRSTQGREPARGQFNSADMGAGKHAATPAATATGKSKRSNPRNARIADCTIKYNHELVITDLSVMEDERAKEYGPWSFGGVMSAMCPIDQNPAEFTANLFDTWIGLHRS